MAIIPIQKGNLVMQYSDKFVKITPLFDRLGKPIPKNAQYLVAVDVMVDGGFPRYYYDETTNALNEEEIEEVKKAIEDFQEKTQINE